MGGCSQTVDLVSFLEEELGEVRSILTSDTCRGIVSCALVYVTRQRSLSAFEGTREPPRTPATRPPSLQPRATRR